jgi:ABC-type multidrug transport system ATPase subunit
MGHVNTVSVTARPSSEPRLTDSVVVIRGLVKQYGSVRAVDGLDLTVGRGEIFGLLGPNGAGKTTTLRTILGLCRPTAGMLLVHGTAPGASASLRDTGALIENPAFYPYLSGRDNLRVLARLRHLPDSSVDAVMSTIGLAQHRAVSFRKYSLGMKQRLGVAAALLGDPSLLVLDEPANGLDPAGVADMRRLMATLRDEGRSVIFASHLLGEVELVCDRIGVLEKGRLVASGTVGELSAHLAAPTIVISATPRELALKTLGSHASVASVVEEQGCIRVKTRCDADERTIGELNAALVLAGTVVHDLRLDRPNLERVYLAVTATADRT